MFSEPTPEEPASDDPLVDEQLPPASSEKWGPRWLPLLLGTLITALLVGNVYVGFEPVVGLCDADPCGETYTLTNAPDVTSEDSWRDKGSLTDVDIVAIGASSVILVFGLSGRYKQARQ